MAAGSTAIVNALLWLRVSIVVKCLQQIHEGVRLTGHYRQSRGTAVNVANARTGKPWMQIVLFLVKKGPQMPVVTRLSRGKASAGLRAPWHRV